MASDKHNKAYLYTLVDYKIKLKRVIITANHDRLKLCQDREVPEWAQKLSLQIIEGTGYTKEKGGAKDQRGYRDRLYCVCPLCLLPGMPVTPRADKISHGLCLFLRYLYTFTMIPFFALLSPDHELPSIWLPTNTIKPISK
jgi:hypothetical protein